MPTPTSLRERQKREVRKHLMENGLRLFSARGVEAVTVEDITRAAGVAKGTFFNHFSSKESLLYDHVERETDRVIEAALAAGTGDTRRALLGMAEPLAGFGRDNRELLLPLGNLKAPLRDRERHHDVRIRERLLGVIEADARIPAAWRAADYLRRLAPIVLGFSLLAFAEEVVFRGYPLAKLATLTGPARANVILSVAFAAAHLGSDAATPLVGLNIFLGSLVVGEVRLSGWGVPAAGGFHAAWNLAQILLGGTVSGIESPVPAVRLVTHGPVPLTGGAFGPEGSLCATVATVLILAVILAGRRTGRPVLPVPTAALLRRDGASWDRAANRRNLLSLNVFAGETRASPVIC